MAGWSPFARHVCDVGPGRDRHRQVRGSADSCVRPPLCTDVCASLTPQDPDRHRDRGQRCCGESARLIAAAGWTGVPPSVVSRFRLCRTTCWRSTRRDRPGPGDKVGPRVLCARGAVLCAAAGACGSLLLSPLWLCSGSLGRLGHNSVLNEKIPRQIVRGGCADGKVRGPSPPPLLPSFMPRLTIRVCSSPVLLAGCVSSCVRLGLLGHSHCRRRRALHGETRLLPVHACFARLPPRWLFTPLLLGAGQRADGRAEGPQHGRQSVDALHPLGGQGQSESSHLQPQRCSHMSCLCFAPLPLSVPASVPRDDDRRRRLPPHLRHRGPGPFLARPALRLLSAAQPAADSLALSIHSACSRAARTTRASWAWATSATSRSPRCRLLCGAVCSHLHVGAMPFVRLSAAGGVCCSARRQDQADQRRLAALAGAD